MFWKRLWNNAWFNFYAIYILYDKNLQSTSSQINIKEIKKLLTYFSDPQTIETIKQVLKLLEKYKSTIEE